MATADPEEQVEESLSQMMLSCAWLGTRQEAVPPEVRAAIEALRDDIAAYLHFLSSKLAKRMRNGWRTDVDDPGYMIRDLNGWEIRVPYHLFDDFPAGDALEEIVRLAARIRFEKGTICLSGSSALYGSLRTAADCDYCEYVDARGDATVADAAAKHAEQIPSGADFLCLPATSWDAKKESYRTYMGHYVAATAFEGVLEISKLIIPLRSDDDALGKSFSFSAQEAPMVSGGGTWLPRVLYEPSELAEYSGFLRKQVGKYLETNVVKALKRLFSLTRITFSWREGDALLDLFDRTDVLLSATLAARTTLAESLSDPGWKAKALETLAALCGRASDETVRALASTEQARLLAALRARSVDVEAEAEVEKTVTDALSRLDSEIERQYTEPIEQRSL